MTAMLDKTVLIMAGGTGGHVYPALAVAEVLRERGYAVNWLGTSGGLEARVVPAKGFPIHFITSVGVRGKGLLNAVKAPLLMMKGLFESLTLINRLKPVSVLGMGGFVSVPGGIACWLMRKPLIIHEQNAIPGTANRLLSRLAKQSLQGFDGAFAHGVYTGNPVRKEITALPKRTPSTDAGKALNILVLGGSLGARPINAVLPQVVKQMNATQQLNVWHQTGTTTCDETLALYRQQQLVVDGETLKVVPYIEDMAAAYRWADLVLCRAGAMTLAEIACAGLPAILVPLPHAIDDHQNKNAQSFVQHGAALLLPQHTMTADQLVMLLSSLMVDRTRLQSLAQHARALAKPAAAQQVADICLNPGGLEKVANG
jgi:UDP-N-acetylglucosamine--N-acetylmuramyl-(pentapeptide) pyrophosphoryl-undecaprenol N-acetylglucosamine transferase